MRYYIFIVVFFIVKLFAEPAIFLRGTVKDKKNKPIAGATVNLASNPSLIDTTNSEGEFTISNSTAIFNDRNRTISSINPTLNGSVLSFFVPSPIEVNISIFTVQGKKCFYFSSDNLTEGKHQLKLPDLGAGFYTLSFNTGHRLTNYCLIKYEKDFFLSSNKIMRNKIYPKIGYTLDDYIDTLIAEKSGYTKVKYPILSYKLDDIAIVMGLEPVYAYGATVENTCEDCNIPELPDASKLTVKNSKLPDPFKKLDGSRITKKSEWHCRRMEVIKQAMKYIYGEKPPRPQIVTGSVTSNKISVHVEENGKKIDFSATIKLPSKGKPPYPAIISVGSFGSVLMGESKILDEGVAVIYYDYSKIGKEKADASAEIRKTDKQGLFYEIYGGRHSTGLLMAWAWGASRLIDVLQMSDGNIIDYRRLGVTGCSRTAKGAFAIALFDERVALALPEETSVGGVPAYRIADAKCPENTTNNFNGQEWLSDNFKPFVNNTALLPIDAHELIAAIAPRGIYIMENPSATQMCAQGGHMAVVAAMEVFKALGCPQNLSYNSNTPSGTSHCSYTSNFTDMLIKNITKFLKHQTAETGGIVAGSGTLNKSDWIDWTPPILENDTNLYKTD